MHLTCTVREILSLKLAFAHVKSQKYFYLFGPQSESLGDIKFRNDEDVLQHFVRKFLQVPIKKLNATSSSRLVEQWEHWSELQGEYIEK